MISIESRDGRKSLGLGFGSDREMEETELEEGEAYDYHDDDDANIDPDVDLSYLDEKVQDVLGHFQKDFEGGVSAENLGAKFGGYGSFLPTYQRSPSIWSQPRTPQKVPSHGTPRSPNNLQLEGDLQNSAVPSGASSSAKHVTGTTGAAPPPSSRAFLESSSKRENLLSARSSVDYNLNNELLNKSNTMADQKTLKVRLKVGSDNVAQKTAAIFSDLGFPPSSPEDSPAESGGLSPESRESPYESPRSILQIMTSSPVLHGALLPPLPDGLLHLTEKQKISKENRPSLASKAGQGTSTILVDESNSVMEEGKFLSGKKVKAVEKGNRLIEMKNETVKDLGNGLNTFLNKEIDTGTPELADSPRPPVLSNPKIRTGETIKGTGRASEVSVEIKRFKFKDKSISSDFAKDSESIDMSEKLKPSANSGDKVWEDRKEKVRKDVQSLSRKDNKSKTNKSYDSCNTSFDGSKGRKELNGGTTDPLENKIKLKMTSFDEGQLPYVTEQAFSSGKKKLKGSKNNGNSTAVFSQESLRAVSSTAPREKRKSSADSSSRNKGDDSKLSREFGKTRETYRDIFGDEEMEQAENSLNSVEMPFRDRPKDYKSEVIAKGKPQFADKPKDKINAKQIYQFGDKSRERQNSKKAVNAPTSEAYEASLAFAPSTANGLVPETVSSIAVPVLVKDHWVCCDTCQKWRLLPHGVEPDDLPKKWSCSMYIWLAGMNSCKISEDVTTNAMNVMNGAPGTILPGSQNNMQNQPNGAAALLTLPEGQHLDSKIQDHNLPAVSGGGKKKHGLKETADTNNLTGTMRFSHAVTNQQASLKSRSLNDVNQSPLDSNLANKAGIQHLSRSNDSGVEKHKYKQKDGHKLAQDEGVSYHSKVKSKREVDHDGSRASKKIKRDGLLNTKEEWNSDNGGGVSGSLAPPVKKIGDYSFSKESKFDSKDSLPSSAKKPKELLQVPLDVGASDVRGFDGRDISAKKRKVKEWQESQVYPSEPHTNANHHLESDKVSLEGTSESDLRKGKKARVSKPEGKMSCKSMGDAGVDKRERAARILNSVSRDCLGDEMEKRKGYVSNDQQPSEHGVANMVSQPMVDTVDPFKKDLAYVMPSLAATSSSSKVSGSRKSKANFQEAKGSPVESVSSSPLRIPDKGTSARRIVLGKDDATNGGFAANGSLRKCSDGEGDGGGDHSGSARKEKAYSVTHRRSSESTVFDYQNKEVKPTSSGKAKAPDDSVCVVGAGTLDQRIQHMELLGKEHGHDDDQANKHYGSLSRKSSKSSSSRSKDKLKGPKSDIDKGKVKRSDSLNNQDGIHPTKNSRNDAETEPHDLHYREESRVGKYSSQEKNGVKGAKDEKSYFGKKEYIEKWSNEGRRESQSRHGGNVGSDVKFSAACSKDEKSNAQRNYTQLRVGEKSSHQSLSDRADHDHLETASGRGKSQAFLQSGDKPETQTRCPRPVSSNHKGNGTDLLRVDGSNCGGGDELKVVKQPRKPDSQSGSAHISLSHSTPGRVNVGDLDGPSPARKDSSSQAANAALKEARDLKHSADRLKNSGSGLESTGLYFEAVLKFLHGASLLEPCNIESSRHGESQSVHVYSTTTSLCEFVAQEYERCKEMAFAALAYKCLEVACMRVVYFKHWSINKDRHELQAALHMVPPGESPSSSASDVDNQGTADKVALAKGVGSPHVAGNHVIAARSRPNFVRVLNFTQDVNSAMEASRKSQNAFAAASATLEDTQYEGISSVKRALDFNFNDVQGLLRLVRVAMEAISR